MIPLHIRLKNELEKHFELKKQSGSDIWYQISCPFCGDSPNPKTKHFNIRLAPDNIFIIKCYQPKCEKTGSLLKYEDMLTLKIGDPNLIKEVDACRKKYIKHEINLCENYLTLPFTVDITSKPYEYFLKRTRIPLDSSFISTFRAVTNLNEFVDMNDTIYVNKFFKEILDSEKKGNPFIGFVNNTGSQIYIRNINDVPEIKKHSRIPLVNTKNEIINHENYILEKNFKYGEPNQYLVLAEGNFDIINAFFHSPISYEGVYVAANTASAIPKVIHRFMKIMIKPNIIWVADSDISDNHIMSKLKPYMNDINEIFILRNKVGKDLGDMSQPVDPDFKKVK